MPVYYAVRDPIAPLINSPTGHRFQVSSGWARWHLWWQSKANPRMFGPVYDELYTAQDPEEAAEP